jgi:hypothetical protein
MDEAKDHGDRSMNFRPRVLGNNMEVETWLGLQSLSSGNSAEPWILPYLATISTLASFRILRLLIHSHNVLGINNTFSLDMS